MNLNRIYIFWIAVLFLISLPLIAAQYAAGERRDFEVDLSTLSSIEQNVTIKKNSYSTLKYFQKQVKNLNQEAVSCIRDEKEKSQKVRKILGYLSGGLDTSIDDYNKFLVQEKDLIKQRLAECSFISYRSEELIRIIESKIAILEEPTYWQKSNSIWELIQNTSFSTWEDKPIPKQNRELIQTVGTTVLLLVFFCLSWLIFSLKYIRNNYSSVIQMVMKFALLSLYFIVLFLFLAGYHHYALMIIPKIIMSALIVVVLYQLIRVISKVQHAFDLNESSFSKKIHTYFGFTHNKTIPELIVLRALLYTSLISWSIMILLHIWGLPEVYRDQILNTAFNGVTVFNITIFPVRILRAIFIFFIMMLLGRYFSNSIMRSQSFQKEYHLQVTISTLIRYVTFIIAAVLALYIAGINFAGVAIALGALLVGVGFGLQQIVSDFISGLILLSNNVVRPADFIAIDNIEGTIKKIRLLSTEIQSDDSIILIPNSFLVSRIVNNYTNEEQIYYADTQVVIGQLSDLKRVEKIILDVAIKNDNVIKNEFHQPYTEIELFNNRGTMGVSVLIYFPIASASQRDEIRTQLNRAILTAFEKEDINMPVMRLS